MALAVVALVMLVESVQRFFTDVTIHFPEAIAVTVIGLVVNLFSAFLLRDQDHHHVWQVGPQHLAAMVAVVTHYPQPPDHYKQLIARVADIAHVRVEVHHCPGEPCLPPHPPA